MQSYAQMDSLLEKLGFTSYLLRKYLANKNWSYARKLLEKNINVNIQGYNYDNILYEALRYDSPDDIIKILITPYNIKNIDRYSSPLVRAISQRYSIDVIEMIIDNGADMDIINWGYDILSVTIFKNICVCHTFYEYRKKLLKLLLEKGANYNVIDFIRLESEKICRYYDNKYSISPNIYKSYILMIQRWAASFVPVGDRLIRDRIAQFL